MKRPQLLFEIEHFLTRHLPHERKVTRSTILSYRDSFKLFLNYCVSQKNAGQLKFDIDLINYEMVLSFLAAIENKRQCGISTRNQRLASIKSFCKFLLLRHPELAASISRVMAIPFKKSVRTLKHYLDEQEIAALLTACVGSKWSNRRDSLMFDFMIQTGARVSELIVLTSESLNLSSDPFVKIFGKGRKERAVPLNKRLAKNLREWSKAKNKSGSKTLFPTIKGTQMSVDAVQFALKKAINAAKKKQKSLKEKNITVHSLRHTAAMRMLNNDVDIYIIALWLGHEKIATTEKYLSESIALKKKALEKIPSAGMVFRNRRAEDPLEFLDDL